MVEFDFLVGVLCVLSVLVIGVYFAWTLYTLVTIACAFGGLILFLDVSCLASCWVVSLVVLICVYCFDCFVI